MRSLSSWNLSEKTPAAIRTRIVVLAKDNESTEGLCHKPFSQRNTDRKTVFSSLVWLLGQAACCVLPRMLYYAVVRPLCAHNELVIAQLLIREQEERTVLGNIFYRMDMQ